jgi:hypothetical protein
MNKHLNHELFEHNIAQRAIKDEVTKIEKETDKNMVQNIVKKEQMLDHLEQEQRVIIMILINGNRRDKRERLGNFS